MSIARALRAITFSRKLVRSFTLFGLLLALTLIVIPASTGHSAQVSLAWDANTESNLAGYKIYYGTASHNYGWVLNVGKVSTYTVTGLTAGLTYYFAATAYNTANLESAPSGEVSTNLCTYSISPSSQSFTAAGGTGTVSVTTQSTCPWTAASGASWMTITSGSHSTGNGTVGYSISANTGPSSRTASSTIAGNVFAVTQAGTSGSTFTITATAGTGGSISPSGAVSVGKGTSTTFAITPNSGYRVASVLVDGTSLGAVTTYTFSNVTANHTIAATFVANSNTNSITASAGTGGAISPSGTVSVSYGTSRTFTITPNTGYRVAGVLVDGTSVGAATNYTFSNVTTNHTIAATFAANNNTIAASAGTGGSISPSGAVSISNGSGTTFTITPNTGYRVAGVLVDGTSVGAVTNYSFSNVTTNHTIAATFAANTTAGANTITASAGTGGSISPSGAVSVSFGDSQTFTLTPYSGYRVTGLVVDGAPATPVTTVIYSKVTSNLGYRVKGKVINGSSANPVTTYTFSNVAANHTIAATFTANALASAGANTITASAGTGGSISPSGAVSVSYGASQPFNFTPNSGYRVASVRVDGTSVGAVTAYTFSAVTANHTIGVTFSRSGSRRAGSSTQY